MTMLSGFNRTSTKSPFSRFDVSNLTVIVLVSSVPIVIGKFWGTTVPRFATTSKDSIMIGAPLAVRSNLMTSTIPLSKMSGAMFI